MINEVKKIASIDDVNFDGNNDLIEEIGADLDARYMEMLKGLSLSPKDIEQQHDLKIVFSSIHGTGITLVPPTLKKFGFTNVTVVDEQAQPDGNFPTVIYPNPEEAEAMAIALKKAEEIDADLVMATDPDADRVGIAVKNLDGEFQLLNGNQTGSLLIYYLLRKWQDNGMLSGKQFVVKTIVTSDLIAAVAAAFDVKCYETLTGFKYIAALIKSLEGQEKFIGGGEESYGYLIGDDVRDKDAIASCAMIAEMAAWAKANGQTVYELLINLASDYGLYVEGLKSVTRKGKSGAEEIQHMMKEFRENPPKELDGSRVVSLLDYQSGEHKNLLDGSIQKLDFPMSNVLQFITEDGAKISIRPSGTEPKIKFYFSVNSDLDDKSDYFALTSQLRDRIDRLAQKLER